jgi:hypothetical protein
MRAATATLVGAFLISGCGAGDEAARRARLEAQRERLVASLEQLEARLLEGQGRVRAWEELRSRHARVSAVACEVNAGHVADMARLEVEERWLAAGARAPRLAAVVPAAALGRGGGVPIQPPDPVPALQAAPPVVSPAAPEPPGTTAQPLAEAVPGSGGD